MHIAHRVDSANVVITSPFFAHSRNYLPYRYVFHYSSIQQLIKVCQITHAEISLPSISATMTSISLPPNLFFGTTIAVNILVLSKHKTDTKIQFIDASGEAYFKKETNTNVLTNQNIEDIMKVFASKKNVDHFTKSINLDVIVSNGYNLSVSSYVDTKDNREVVNITELNAELKTTVAKINQLRSDIDVIVAEIEGKEISVST